MESALFKYSSLQLRETLLLEDISHVRILYNVHFASLSSWRESFLSSVSRKPMC